MRVLRRDSETLTGEILDNVLPETHICTDGWAVFQTERNLSGSQIFILLVRITSILNHQLIIN